MRRMSPSRTAFTLIEVLVAMSILVVLSLFVAKIVGATHTTIALSNRVTNTDADARLVFNRLALDLGALVKRRDADLWAGNPSAMGKSDLLLFLSGVASDNSDSPSGGNRGYSLVAYRVAASPENPGLVGENLPCLLRAGKAVGWSTTGLVGLKANGLPIRFNDASPAFPAVLVPGKTTDFDVLAPGVVKMVVGFQLSPDNASATLEDGTVIANARGQLVYSPPIRALKSLDGTTTVNYVDASRIASLVVGLVVIDNASLKLLNAAQVTRLAGRFALPATGTLPVRSWTATLNGLVAELSGSIPLPALQSTHLYECAFPVTPRGEVVSSTP